MNYGDIIMRKKKGDFSFCYKKAGGLNLVNPNETLVRVYRRKSRSALNILDSAKEKQEYDWILDASYYAKYFIIYALFMKEEILMRAKAAPDFCLKVDSIVDNISKENIERVRKKFETLKKSLLV